jgi:hypothetical protein
VSLFDDIISPVIKEEDMTNVSKKIKEFIKHSFNNVRSTCRTIPMHNAILEEFLNNCPEYKDYEWEHEWILKEDGIDGTFKIDIVGLKNGKPKVFLLCKSINSSFAKNAKNYANNMMGEMHRIMDSDIISPELLLFVNIYPRFVPVFDGKGKVKHYDNVEKSKSRAKVAKIMKKYFKNKAFEVNISYDIEDVYNKKCRDDFLDINPKNISKFEFGYED